MRNSLFSNEDNEIILNYIREFEILGNVRNKYKRISKVLPKYQAHQIRQHYLNNLNLGLCKDALKNDEKLFILQWAEQNQDQNGTVHWKHLIPVMTARFGKLHSENKIKNFWYPRKLRLARLARSAGTAVQALNPSNGYTGYSAINASHHFNPPLPVLPVPPAKPLEPIFQPSYQFKVPDKMEPLF